MKQTQSYLFRGSFIVYAFVWSLIPRRLVANQIRAMETNALLLI